MVALNPPAAQFGLAAPDFLLPGTDGQMHSLNSCRGPRGLLVMFICNHCPYVQAIIDRLITDCHHLHQAGIGCVAIMSNDTEAYPADRFEEMQKWSQTLHFPFPYLIDSTQEIARAYGAVCTPDFFGYNHDMTLQFRGRLDASGKNPAPANCERELLLSMLDIADTGFSHRPQTASIGCSIKWKTSC